MPYRLTPYRASFLVYAFFLRIYKVGNIMNIKEQSLFIYRIRNLKLFKRLKNVTTMLPPPGKYTDRLTHTNDVLRIGKQIDRMCVSKMKMKHIRNLGPACIIHDIGHCCFAHEAEVVLNDFIASKLCIPKEKVCFSHAVNGALVLAIASRNTKCPTDFSNANYFRNSKYDMDMKIIIDSMIKHSFKDEFVNSVYFRFVESQYNYETGKTLLRKTRNNKNPIYETGYYVRVADDIASKNSDVMDLMSHYYKTSISRKNRKGLFYIISDGYITQIYKEIKKTKNQIFNIEKIFTSLPTYIAQKNMLNVSYNFSYKRELTKEAQTLISDVAEAIFNRPSILRMCGQSHRHAYIAEIFEAYSKKLGFNKFNDFNAFELAKKYLLNIYNIQNNYKKAFCQYVCAIAFEISNFTDKGIVDFARKINKNRKLSTKIRIGKLLNTNY